MKGASIAGHNRSKAIQDYAATESLLDVVHQCRRVCTPGQRLPVLCLSQRLEALVWRLSLVRQLRPRQVSETRLHCLQLQSRPGSAQLALMQIHHKACAARIGAHAYEARAHEHVIRCFWRFESYPD